MAPARVGNARLHRRHDPEHRRADHECRSSAPPCSGCETPAHLRPPNLLHRIEVVPEDLRGRHRQRRREERFRKCCNDRTNVSLTWAAWAITVGRRGSSGGRSRRSDRGGGGPPLKSVSASATRSTTSTCGGLARLSGSSSRCGGTQAGQERPTLTLIDLIVARLPAGACRRRTGTVLAALRYFADNAYDSLRGDRRARHQARRPALRRVRSGGGGRRRRLADLTSAEEEQRGQRYSLILDEDEALPLCAGGTIAARERSGRTAPPSK